MLIDFKHAQLVQFESVIERLKGSPKQYLDFASVADFYQANWLGDLPSSASWAVTGLDDGADGLSVVTLDEIVHLGQHHGQTGHLFRMDLTGEHIGELQGLVLGYFDLFHVEYLGSFSDLPQKRQ